MHVFMTLWQRSSSYNSSVVKGKDKGGKIMSTLFFGDCLHLISIVDAVEVLEAFKRIPDEFRDYTFFGSDDRWLYIKSGNPKLCENCLGYDGEVFYGDSLDLSFRICELLMRTRLTPMSIRIVNAF